MTFQDLMGDNYEGDCKIVKTIYKNNKAHFEDLVKDLGSGNVIPLFGAGFSGGAYKGWGALLSSIAENYGCDEAVNALLAKGAFEEAASALYEDLGPGDYAEEMTNALGRKTLPEAMEKVSPERKLLPHIFTGPLLTTNVDQVLEEIYSSSRLNVVRPHNQDQQSQVNQNLQGTEQVLIKLHGDADDPANMVFTREQYDAVYGQKLEGSPLVQTLKQAFQSRKVLFLGCSLETDRVLKVLEKCSTGLTYYALVGLPRETENTANPFMPNLLGPDKKQIPAYHKRRKFLSNHNIKCIWYPYNQFQAMDVLLQELYDRLAPAARKKKSAIPPLRHDIIGREAVSEEIYNRLTQEAAPVFAIGPGGIGKTEVCHKVLRRMESEGMSVIYGNLTGIQDPIFMCHTLAKAVDARPWIDGSEVHLEPYLSFLFDRITAWDKGVLYLDNWEDLWYGLSSQEEAKLTLLDWLSRISHAGIPVLLSSRDMPEEYDISIQPVPIRPLSREKGEDKQLFIQTYRQKNGFLSTQGPAFEKLLAELDGHPLTIRLTATQAVGIHSWDTLLETWARASQKSPTQRHNSLTTALKISWDAVAAEPGCKLLWGLLALSDQELAYEQLMKLAKNKAQRQQWDAGLQKLRRASLLDWVQEGTALKMLQPVKESFFLLAPTEDAILCMSLWGNFWLNALIQADDKKSIKQHDAYIMVVQNLPHIFCVLDRMLDEPYPKSFIKMIFGLSSELDFYYQLSPLKGLALCEKLIRTPLCIQSKLFFAYIARSLGRLYCYFSKLDMAQAQYQTAEQLYKELGNEQGLANIRYLQGVLYELFNQLDKAASRYQEAEFFYKKLHDNLGLANTHLTWGRIFHNQGLISKAETHYANAEQLYTELDNDLGLANIHESWGELYYYKSMFSEAAEHFTKAECLYEKLQDNQGLAHAWSGRIDVLRRTNQLQEAERAASRAEYLYKQALDDMGLSNTYLSHSMVKIRLSDEAAAHTLLFASLTLFEKARNPYGITFACTLLARVIENQKGQCQEAADLAQRALEEGKKLTQAQRDFIQWEIDSLWPDSPKAEEGAVSDDCAISGV